MQHWTSPPPPGTPLNAALGVVTVFLPGTTEDALLTQSGGGGALTYSDGGLRRSFTGNQAGRYRNARTDEKNNSASILWVGKCLGAASAYASLGGVTYTTSDTYPYVCIELKRNGNSGGNDIYLNNSLGGAPRNIFSPSITTGEVVLVGSVSSGAQSLWMLNRSTATVSVNRDTITGSLTSTSNSRFEVGESVGARNPNAECELLAIFNRALSDSECQMLLENPYAVFAPRMYTPTLGPPSAAAGFLGAWASQRSRIIGAGLH